MFNDAFFIILLRKNISLKSVKRVLIILALGFSSFFLPILVTQFFLFSYFLFSSYICFLDESSFWSTKEFSLLGILPQFEFRLFLKVFLIQRFIIDGLFEFIIFLLVFLSVFYLQNADLIFWFIILSLAYIGVQPYYYLLKYWCKQLLPYKISFDIILILIIGIGLMLQNNIIINTLFLVPTLGSKILFFLIIFGSFLTLILTTLFLKDTRLPSKKRGTKKLIIFIKKINFLIYKDVLINKTQFFLMLLLFCSFYLFTAYQKIIVKNELEIFYFSLTVIPLNMFSDKIANRYALIKKDSFFFEDNKYFLKEYDILLLNKFLCVHINTLIKIVISTLFLFEGNILGTILFITASINSSNYLFARILKSGDRTVNVLEKIIDVLIRGLDLLVAVLLIILGNYLLSIVYIIVTIIYSFKQLNTKLNDQKEKLKLYEPEDMQERCI